MLEFNYTRKLSAQFDMLQPKHESYYA